MLILNYIIAFIIFFNLVNFNNNWQNKKIIKFKIYSTTHVVFEEEGKTAENIQLVDDGYCEGDSASYSVK